MPNKDADTKNSPKEELLEARGIPAEADNTSIAGTCRNSSIPDPELAALRADLRQIKNVSWLLTEDCIDEIMQLFTAHHNALLNKVLGLIGEGETSGGTLSEFQKGYIKGRVTLKAQLRDSVEKLKEE